MNEEVFWTLIDEILDFGDFIIAIPNSGASANIVGKISIGKDGSEKVIEKDACHCHVYLQPEKIGSFSFIFIDAGYGDEPCCELLTPQDEIVLRLYLRGDMNLAKEKFAEFIGKFSEYTEVVKGGW